MSPCGAWRGEGRTDLQRPSSSWMRRLGLIPVQREDGPIPDGLGDGDPRLRPLPSRSIASSSVDSSPTPFALQARRLRRVVFPEWAGPEPAMPRCRVGAHAKLLASALPGGAAAEGARDLSGLAVSRRKKARRQLGLRMSSLRRRASEPRPDGVVLRVAGSGRGGERYERSHWCDERGDGKLPPHGSTAGIGGRCAGATAYAGGGAGDRIGGDARVGAGEAGNGKRRNAMKVFSTVPQIAGGRPGWRPPLSCSRGSR